MKRLLLLAILVFGTVASAPERFAPFAVPEGSWLQDPAFSPDGTSLFLTRIDPSGDSATLAIVISTLRDGAWSAPTVAPFSGRWTDLTTVFSADGNEIIFASNRPAKDGGAPIDGFWGGKPRPGHGGNLWSVERQGAGWGAPVRLPDAVNGGTAIFSPALAADGTLYFMKPSGPKSLFHLFIAKREDGVYRSSEPASFSNDPDHQDVDPTVAPDNSFVIFTSNRPPSRPGTAELFITFRHGDTWSAPEAMDSSIDPNGDAIEARLSPDLKTLYYTSNKAPHDLMRVDVSQWTTR